MPTSRGMRLPEFERTILNQLNLLLNEQNGAEELRRIFSEIDDSTQLEVVRGILEEFERGTTNNDIARMVGTQASSQGSSLSNPNVPTLLDIIEKLRLDRDSLVAENTNLQTAYLGDRPEPRREPRREPSRDRQQTSPRSGAGNITVEEGDHKFYTELYEALKEDNPDFEKAFKEAVLVEDMTFDEIFDISNRNKFVMALDDIGITTRKSGKDVQRSGDWHPVGNQLYEFVDFDSEISDWWVNQTPSGNAVQEFAKKNKTVLSHTGLKFTSIENIPDNWVMLNQFSSDRITDQSLPLKSPKEGDVTISSKFDELADAHASNRLFIFPEDMETVQNKLGKLHNKIIKTKLFEGGSDTIVSKLGNEIGTGDSVRKTNALFSSRINTTAHESSFYKSLNLLYGRNDTNDITRLINRAVIDTVSSLSVTTIGSKKPRGAMDINETIVKDRMPNGSPKKWFDKIKTGSMPWNKIKNRAGQVFGLIYTLPDGTDIITTLISSDSNRTSLNNVINPGGSITANFINLIPQDVIGAYPSMQKIRGIKGNLVRHAISWWKEMINYADETGVYFNNSPINTYVGGTYHTLGGFEYVEEIIGDVDAGYDGNGMTRVPIPPEINELGKSRGGKYRFINKIIDFPVGAPRFVGDTKVTRRPIHNALDSRDVKLLIAASEGFYDSDSDYMKRRDIRNKDIMFKYLKQRSVDANSLFPIYSDKINNLDKAISSSYLADFTTLNEIFNLISNDQIRTSDIARILLASDALDDYVLGDFVEDDIRYVEHPIWKRNEPFAKSILDELGTAQFETGDATKFKKTLEGLRHLASEDFDWARANMTREAGNLDFLISSLLSQANNIKVDLSSYGIEGKTLADRIADVNGSYTLVEDARQLPAETLQTYKDTFIREGAEVETVAEVERPRDVVSTNLENNLTQGNLYRELENQAMAQDVNVFEAESAEYLNDIVNDTDLAVFVPDDMTLFGQMRSGYASSPVSYLDELEAFDGVWQMDVLNERYQTLANMFELGNGAINNVGDGEVVHTGKKISDYFRHEFMKNIDKIVTHSERIFETGIEIIAADIEVTQHNHVDDFIEMALIYKDSDGEIKKTYAVTNVDIRGGGDAVTMYDTLVSGAGPDNVPSYILKNALLTAIEDLEKKAAADINESPREIRHVDLLNDVDNILEHRMFAMGRVGNALGAFEYRYNSFEGFSEHLLGDTTDINSMHPGELQGGSDTSYIDRDFRNTPDRNMNIGTLWQSITFDEVVFYNLYQTEFTIQELEIFMNGIESIAENNDIIISGQIADVTDGGYREVLDFEKRGNNPISEINRIDELATTFSLRNLQIDAPSHLFGPYLDTELNKVFKDAQIFSQPGRQAIGEMGNIGTYRMARNQISDTRSNLNNTGQYDIDELRMNYSLNRDVGTGFGNVEGNVGKLHSASPVKPVPLRKELRQLAKAFAKTPVGKSLGFAWKGIDIGETLIASGFKKASESAAKRAIAKGLGAAGAAAASAPITFAATLWGIYEISNLIIQMGQEIPDMVSLIKKRNNVMKNGQDWEKAEIEDRFWKDMGKEALEGLQGAAKYSPAEQIADFIWQPAFDAIGKYAEGRDETELNFPVVETVPDTNDIYYSNRTPQDKLDLMQDRIDYDTLFYGYLNNNPDANVVADRTLELTNTVYNR